MKLFIPATTLSKTAADGYATDGYAAIKSELKEDESTFDKKNPNLKVPSAFKEDTKPETRKEKNARLMKDAQNKINKYMELMGSSLAKLNPNGKEGDTATWQTTLKLWPRWFNGNDVTKPKFRSYEQFNQMLDEAIKSAQTARQQATQAPTKMHGENK